MRYYTCIHCMPAQQCKRVYLRYFYLYLSRNKTSPLFGPYSMKNYYYLTCWFRYKTDINAYKEKVKESIESCRQAAMNPDPSDPHSVKYVAYACC